MWDLKNIWVLLIIKSEVSTGASLINWKANICCLVGSLVTSLIYLETFMEYKVAIIQKTLLYFAKKLSAESIFG